MGYHLHAMMTYADGQASGRSESAQSASAVVPAPGPTPCALPASAASYDTNNNCAIDLPEGIKASTTTSLLNRQSSNLRSVVTMIDLYLFGNESSPQHEDAPAATPPSATRAFSTASVAPDGQVVITHAPLPLSVGRSGVAFRIARPLPCAQGGSCMCDTHRRVPGGPRPC